MCKGKTYILYDSIWPVNIHCHDRQSGEDQCPENETKQSKQQQ